MMMTKKLMSVSAVQWLQKRNRGTRLPFMNLFIASKKNVHPPPPVLIFSDFYPQGGTGECNGYKRGKGRPGDRRNCVSRLLPAAADDDDDDDEDDDDDRDDDYDDEDDDDDHHGDVDVYEDYKVDNAHHHKINDDDAAYNVSSR